MWCVRGNGRKEMFTGHILALKRGARAGGKQLLAVDGVRGGATRPREEEPVGSIKRRVGELAARWRRKSSEGQLVARESAGDGRWAVLQRNREGKAGGRRRGPIQNFPKVQGVHCKVKFPSNHSSNEIIPKIKSVELKKIYHFALGSSFKIIRVSKLFQNPINYAISNKTYLNFTCQMKP
jgi:hypothetical protein